jgi:hypothetical protein
MTEWTIATLKEYAEALLNAQEKLFTRRSEDADKAIQAALVSAEKAVTKAETATEKRFEGQNEFRGQLNDVINTFMPRAEYSAAHQAVIDRIDAISAKGDADIARNTERINALELRLTSRLDIGSGQDTGAATQRSESRLNLGTLISAGLLMIGLLTFIILYATKP